MCSNFIFFMAASLPLLALALESDSSEEDEEIDHDQSELKKSSLDKGESKINSLVPEQYESSDYIDAKKKLSNNVWDVNAWNTLIEEVENSRGGKTSPLEVYLDATSQFPRSAGFWKKLVEYYAEIDNILSCEDSYRKCLPKCRSVELWMSYLTFKKNIMDKHPSQSEQYAKARGEYENAFKKALQNVGMSIESNVIWRTYLEFVKSWPQVSTLDDGKKQGALRDIYKGAICVPMDDLER
jgi:cleavage stimulation factor subunit 3